MSQSLTPAKRLAHRLVAAQARTTSQSALPLVRRSGVARYPSTSPVSIRRFSTPTSPAESSSRFRPKVSHLFGGLVGLGLLLTIYGLLEFYFTLRTWPEPVRVPLRAALKARNQGKIDLSERYFKQAIDAALSLPQGSLEPQRLLKISGIYISLAAILEEDDQLLKVYTTLRESLQLFGPSALKSDYAAALLPDGDKCGEEEHKRAIKLSQKLGEVALQLGSMPAPPPYPIEGSGEEGRTWDAAAEKYLEEALAAMLRLGLMPGASPAATGRPVVAGRDVILPENETEGGGLNRRGLAMTMESLAEVYARKGRNDLSAQLLLQAISVLLPPQGDSPPIQDRCQAALFMTSLSARALNASDQTTARVSKSWCDRALQIAEQGLDDDGKPLQGASVCARARSVGLYNLGMLAEMGGDTATAVRHFREASKYSKDIGFAEGRREADEAIRRHRGLRAEAS